MGYYQGQSGAIETGYSPDQIAQIQSQLQQAGGSMYDPTDLEGVLRHTGYTGAGASDLSGAVGNQMAIYRDRAGTPGAPRSATDFASSSGSGGGSGTRPSTSGTAASQAQYDEIMKALQASNPNPVNAPAFTVPGDNLSPSIDDALLHSIQGNDPLGLGSRYSAVLDRTAGGGVNSQRLATRTEQARENLTRGETAAMNDFRSSLADRGLISQPGSPQGPELDAQERAFQPLQHAYLDELRTSNVDESQRADTAEMSALTAATGWSQGQAAQMLAGANSASARQQMLSNVALQSLAQNADWNKFLATFGLSREQLAYQIQQGRIDSITPILQLFQALQSSTNQGYI